MGAIANQHQVALFGSCHFNTADDFAKEGVADIRDNNQNGYYEFTSDFSYDNNDRSIIIKQSGYRIDERRGRKMPIFKIHKTTIDNYSF